MIGEAGALSGNFPRTIDAGKGRKLTLPRAPQRIVSVMISTDEILSALVEPSRIQGITYLAEESIISNVTEWAKNIPHKIQQDIEQILACEPDIVFVANFTRAEVVKLLLDLELPVVQIEFQNTIDLIKNDILKIANAVGEEEKAIKLIKEMDQKLMEIALKIKTVKNRPRVLNYGPSGRTSGQNTSLHELIVRGGGINIPAEQGLEGGQVISLEKLIEWNPDIILVSGYSPGKETFPDELKIHPALQTVSAIKNNRVHVIHGKYFTTTSQFIVKAVEEIARILHPELFPSPQIWASKEGTAQ